jgi:tRNA nucleotidyltransferase/poly(A) polymerase
MVILTMKLSPRLIEEKILGDEFNAAIFKKGSGGIYLVGGYLRDLFRRMNSSDRDYVVTGNFRVVVKGIRKSIGGTIVEFIKDTMLRIALREGLTFDFSRPNGSLEEDLTKRDFTINAIAWSPETGIIDLHNGLEDLKNKEIRCIAEGNMIDDPLRILRAYRFAAELNASIECRTRNILKRRHKKIYSVASERITLEFLNLLNSKYSAEYLKMSLSDGLLSDILSIPYKLLERNIRAISKLENDYLNMLPRTIKGILNNKISQNLTYKGLLCLETLFQDTIESLDTGHRLTLSNTIKKRIEGTRKGNYEYKRKGNKEERLFSVFMNAGDSSADVLILLRKSDLIKDYHRFSKIWHKGLLSSREIIDISGVKGGPRLGSLILKAKKAQFTRQLTTRKQAEQFVRRISKDLT